MKNNENLILSPELLKQEEQPRISLLLLLLQDFIKNVPVAHFDHKHGGSNPIFRTDPDGNEDFYTDDYSYLLERSSHTGVELVKMIRLFGNYVNNYPKPVTTGKKGMLKRVDIWEIFVRDIPTYTSSESDLSKAKKEYSNFIKSQMDLFDSVTMPLTLLLEKKSPYDDPKFDYTGMFYTEKFRDNAPDPDLNHFIPQDEKSKNFFFTINIFRNKKEHWGVSPFNPPADPEKEFIHYHHMHLRMILYFMIVFDRFYDELWDIFVKEKDVMDVSTLGEKPAEDSKRLLKQFYIKRLHKESEAKMKSLFHGTGLSDRIDLLYDLPEILLKKETEDGKTKVGDCVDMLVNDSDSKRKAVIGPAGSGKTVMFLRMIQRNQPMLTPFYIELKDFHTADYLPCLEKTIIAEDRLIITKYTLTATLKRIRNLLETGSAVFFIDSAEAARENLQNLAQFIRQYPECHYIIASQQDDIQSSLKGFQRYEILPFNEAQATGLMKLMSLHLAEVDHTEKLNKEIHRISKEITNNPLTLTQLIYMLEKDTEGMNGNLSRPMLFWKLYNSIDSDDRQMLQERSFMQQFFKNLSQVIELCSSVITMYEKNTKSDWASLILDFELVKSDLKQFYDLTEIIGLYDRKQLNNSLIFKTLATTAILEDRITYSSSAPRFKTEENGVSIKMKELPGPNPALQEIAKAIRDLAFIGPSGQDIYNSGTTTGKSRIAYRLQPKYIVRQHIISLLTIYRKAGADIKSHPEHIQKLFNCIAYSGDEELLKEVFTPYWIRQWLINKNDMDAPEKGLVYGKRHSPLREALIQECTEPHIFGILLLRQSVWMDAWEMTHTRNLQEGSLYELIVHHMNDDQREKFVNRLPELNGLIDNVRLGYYKNLAISSMDSIYLLEEFDFQNKTPLGEEIINHLKDRGAYIPALRILISYLEHLVLVKDEKQRVINGEASNTLIAHLVRYGVLKSTELKERFWYVIRECQYNIRHYLDKIPLEEILPDIALKAYHKEVWEHLSKIHEYEERRLTEWVEPVYEKTSKELYLPVSKTHKSRTSVQYTFYSQPEDCVFIVATECINEMPEQKFCRIKKFDQWFYVEDVIVLGKELSVNSIADITVNLPDGLQRRRTGTIVLGENNKFNYIHQFEHGTSRQTVVRIDNADAISWLSEPGRIESLKKNRKILYNGAQATIAGIDIKQLRNDMRLVVLKPVLDDGNAFSIKEKKISGIPLKGTLSFYHNKDMVKYPNGLTLKVPSEAYLAEKSILQNSIYLGIDCGMHYIISETKINAGNHLLWANSPLVGEIAFSHTLDRRLNDKNIPVPSSIMDFVDKMYASDKNAFKSPVAYISTMILHQQDRDFYQQELYAPGAVMDEASIMFYHPVNVPERSAWKHVEHKISVDSVTGISVEIEGMSLIAIPKTTYPAKAIFYSTPEFPTRMPVSWHTLSGEGERYNNTMFIIVDPMVKLLLKRETTVQFFEQLSGGNALEIRFERLTDLIDMAKSARYHSSITPLLIKEWIKEGNVDTFRYQFCKNKQYLGKLVQECIYHKIPVHSKWKLKLNYIVEIKTGNEVIMFSPPETFHDIEEFKKGESTYSGNIPKGLKAGDLVIHEKGKLTILNEKCIRELSRFGQWGFMRGYVDIYQSKEKSYAIIRCNGLKMWFGPDRSISKALKKKEVVFFPALVNQFSMGTHMEIL